MRLEDNARVSAILEAGLARLGVNLKELWRSQAGQEWGKSYQALSTYLSGRRVPQTLAEREALSKLFQLEPAERDLMLDTAGAQKKVQTDTLAGVVAKDLQIYSFTDILARYFESGAESIPSEAVIFSTGKALALDSSMIRRWLNSYLREEGRRVVYVFPPPASGEDHAAELDRDLNPTDWKSDLFSVVAQSIRVEPIPTADHKAFRKITDTNPIPQMFAAFGMGRTILALRFEKRCICFVTMPVHESFYEKLKGRTEPTHPPALYVRIDSKEVQKVEADLNVLVLLREKAEQIGYWDGFGHSEPVHLFPFSVADLLKKVADFG